MKRTMFPREFVEWFLWGQHPFIAWYDEKGAFITDEVSSKRWTLDELYQYWRLEIEPKTKEERDIVLEKLFIRKEDENK